VDTSGVDVNVRGVVDRTVVYTCVADEFADQRGRVVAAAEEGAVTAARAGRRGVGVIMFEGMGVAG
jgi:hypothetical protein